MDPSFPFVLPLELELLVLAYAADRRDVSALFVAACGSGEALLARRLALLFELTPAEVRGENNAALAAACAHGRLEIVRWLVTGFGLAAADVQTPDHWFPPNNYHMCRSVTCSHALFGAWGRRHLDVVRWLTGHLGLSAGAWGGLDRALEMAGQAGSPFIQWMFARFALTAADAWASVSPFRHILFGSGQYGAVRWLAERFAPDTELPSACRTALHNACAAKRLFLARWLVRQGAAGLGRSVVAFAILWESRARGGFAPMCWLAGGLALEALIGTPETRETFNRLFMEGRLEARWLAFRAPSVADARGELTSLVEVCLCGHLRTADWLDRQFGLAAPETPRLLSAQDLLLVCNEAHLAAACWLASRSAVTADRTDVYSTLLGGRRGDYASPSAVCWLANRFGLTGAPGSRTIRRVAGSSGRTGALGSSVVYRLAAVQADEAS